MKLKTAVLKNYMEAYKRLHGEYPVIHEKHGYGWYRVGDKTGTALRLADLARMTKELNKRVIEKVKHETIR
jgi:hypothetical protein